MTTAFLLLFMAPRVVLHWMNIGINDSESKNIYINDSFSECKIFQEEFIYIFFLCMKNDR